MEYKGTDTTWKDPFTASATTTWAYEYENGSASAWFEETKNLRSDLVWNMSILVTLSQYSILFKNLPQYGFRKIQTDIGNNDGDLTRTFRKGDVDVYLTTKLSDGVTDYTLEVTKPTLAYDMSGVFKK